jgi:integrase
VRCLKILWNRRVLIVMFSFAMQRSYATVNPAETTTKAKLVSGVPDILTVGETARLLESAEADVLPFLAIGCFAGLRPAELSRLEWENVDFEAGLIEVTADKSKTARCRFVKIRLNLAAWLAPYRAHKGQVCCGKPSETRRGHRASRWHRRMAIQCTPPSALRTCCG